MCRPTQFFRAPFLIFFSFLFLVSCENFSLLPKEKGGSEESSDKEVTNGLKKTYRSDGSLYSEVTLKNGIKHGPAKSFYNDGKVLLAMYYRDGKKDSTSTNYYRDGSVKRTTQYEKGFMHGERISYFNNGNLSAKMEYIEGRPKKGLVEYYKSGKLIEQPKLKVNLQDYVSVNGKFSIEVYFEGKPTEAEFYIGELREDGSFDKNILEGIPGNGMVGTLSGSLAPGTFLMKKLAIIGTMKTKKGNILVQTTSYNLALGG